MTAMGLLTLTRSTNFIGANGVGSCTCARALKGRSGPAKTGRLREEKWKGNDTVGESPARQSWQVQQLQPELSHLVLQAVVHTSTVNTETPRLGSQPRPPALPLSDAVAVLSISNAIAFGISLACWVSGTLLVTHLDQSLAFFLNQNSHLIQESPSSPVAQIKLFQRSGS